MKTVFLRVLESDNKAAALLEGVLASRQSRGGQLFEVDARAFATIPRSPFAYWVSDRLRMLFSLFVPFGANGRLIASGGKTLDDFRWIRTAWEVPVTEASEWVGFAKGGSFSPYYADIHLLLDWRNNARSLKEYLVSYRRTRGWSPNWTAELHGSDHYLRAGLTWPRRTNGLSFRVMPANCVFADKGPAAFVENDRVDDLLALASVVNSSAFGLLVSFQLARTELAQSYEVGLIQTTPVPNLTDSDREALARLGRRAWSLKRSLDTRTETSHAFVLPSLLMVAGADLPARVSAWTEHVRTVEAELDEIQAEIDERCFVLYGIEEVDRRAITEGFGPRESEERSVEGTDDTEDDAGDYADESESVADSAALAAKLLSWAVGVAFGRFDVRLASGARPLPADPEPFDPLLPCSPGTLTGTDDLPLARPPADYPLDFSEIGVVGDDPGYAPYLKSAVRGVFDLVFGADADRWWNDVGLLLDPKGSDLGVWLAGSFFEHHVKCYSKSRRKAPIYWQLATPSGSYSLWLYAHRLTRDSLFQIQKDIVAPKLMHEERELARIARDAGLTPTSEQRKAITSQEIFVAELRAFRDEVVRVAPLWAPNLDDGIVLTSAPLWRLFPQHKAWQKELKGYWDELCAGRYDWSHLAMHLWPERVVPICATDRSIAIAHGLEEVFWVEDGNGKWTLRPNPTRSIEELVAGRTSPAVKAALKSLIEAPSSAGGTTRGRRRRE